MTLNLLLCRPFKWGVDWNEKDKKTDDLIVENGKEEEKNREESTRKEMDRTREDWIGKEMKETR